MTTNSTFPALGAPISRVGADDQILQEAVSVFSVAVAGSRSGTFVPGFGCTIADAVQASCSAYPFFDRKFVTTAAGVVLS